MKSIVVALASLGRAALYACVDVGDEDFSSKIASLESDGGTPEEGDDGGSSEPDSDGGTPEPGDDEGVSDGSSSGGDDQCGNPPAQSQKGAELAMPEADAPDGQPAGYEVEETPILDGDTLTFEITAVKNVLPADGDYTIKLYCHADLMSLTTTLTPDVEKYPPALNSCQAFYESRYDLVERWECRNGEWEPVHLYGERVDTKTCDDHGQAEEVLRWFINRDEPERLHYHSKAYSWTYDETDAPSGDMTYQVYCGADMVFDIYDTTPEDGQDWAGTRGASWHLREPVLIQFVLPIVWEANGGWQQESVLYGFCIGRQSEHYEHTRWLAEGDFEKLEPTDYRMSSRVKEYDLFGDLVYEFKEEHDKDYARLVKNTLLHTREYSGFRFAGRYAITSDVWRMDENIYYWEDDSPWDETVTNQTASTSYKIIPLSPDYMAWFSDIHIVEKDEVKSFMGTKTYGQSGYNQITRYNRETLYDVANAKNWSQFWDKNGYLNPLEMLITYSEENLMGTYHEGLRAKWGKCADEWVVDDVDRQLSDGTWDWTWIHNCDWLYEWAQHFTEREETIVELVPESHTEHIRTDGCQ